MGDFINGISMYSNESEEVLVDQNISAVNKSDLKRKQNLLKSALNSEKNKKNRKSWDLLIEHSKNFNNNLLKSGQESSDIYSLIESGYINGVPHYYQDNWHYNSCGPTSAGQLLGYWDNKLNYKNLVDWGESEYTVNPIGVTDMIKDLMITMNFNPVNGTSAFNVSSGIEEFCNDLDYKNNLDFNASIHLGLFGVNFKNIKENVNISQPLIIGVFGEYHKSDGKFYNMHHYMTVVGYKEYNNPEQRIIMSNDNYGNVMEINIDLPYDNIIIWEVEPGGYETIKPICNILPPPNSNSETGGIIPLTVFTSDESGIWLVDYEYSFDKANWINAGTVNNFSHSNLWFTLDFNSYNISYEPNVWFRSRAKDNSGNYSNWGILSSPITINNKAAKSTDIILTFDINPKSTTPNSPVTVSGTAVYNDNTVVNGSCLIGAGGKTWTASVAYGGFSKNISAPSSSGYVEDTVSDGNLSSIAQKYLTIIGDGKGANFEFYRSTMCQDVKSNDPYDPIDETQWFRSSDEMSYCWTHYRNLYVPIKTKWEWTRPDGSKLDDTFSSYTDDPGNGYYDWWKLWSYYTINGTDQADQEGRHSIDIYTKEYGGNYKYMESQYYVISYDFKEHKMCKGVSNNLAVNPTNIFKQSDSKAYTWSKYTDVSESIETKTDWIEPNGTIYFSHLHDTEDPGAGYYFPDYSQWSWIDIADNSAANKCGLWKMNKYEKDPFGNWDLVYKENFQIIESPNVNPNITVEPSKVVENSDIIVSIQGTDNTYIEKVIFYWNDGTLHSHEWNNIYQNQVNNNYNIGQFIEGKNIKIYAKIFDTSGNIYQCSANEIIIEDSDTEGPILTNILITEYNGNGDGFISGNEKIKISCSAEDISGVKDVSYILNNDTSIQASFDGVYYAILDPLPGDSTYFLIIAAEDNDESPAYTSVYDYFEVQLPSLFDANFESDIAQGILPLTVNFQDLSSSENITITSWFWDFGDGETSTEQNPDHVYSNTGVYSVSLTVGDGSNSNIETKIDYITVLQPSPNNLTATTKIVEFWGELKYLINLNWTAPNSETQPTGYKIYYSDAETGPFGTFSIKTSSYLFEVPFGEAESWWFYVTAVYEAGESAPTTLLNVLPDVPLLTIDGPVLTSILRGEQWCWSCWDVESHWYRFYAPPITSGEKKCVEILASGGLDLLMQLYKGDMNTLIEKDFHYSPYRDAQIRLTNTTGEWYYVKVTASTSGTYNIGVKTLADYPYKNIIVGWPYNESYLRTPETMEYRFTTGAAGIYTMQTGGSLNTVLGLYDSNGLIEQDDDDGEGTNALIQRTLEANSNYILRFTASSNGNFSIIVNAPITELFVNDPCVSSSIIYATEVDWYKFRTGMAGKYAIDQSVNSLLYVSLYENDKTTLLATGGYPGEAGQQYIEQELNANTEYYIKINSAYDWHPPEIVNSPYCISVKPAKPAPFLIVSPTNISLGGESGTNGIIDITSDTNWSILTSANAYWIGVSAFSGSNNGTITVTANSANTGISPRTGIVTIRGEGLTDKTVTVTQNENVPNCPQHFQTVWEGTLGVDHMNINIIDAKYDGLDLEPGDEIGIFDGNLCVGYGKLTQTIDQQNNLSIKVSKSDGSGNGYIVGHQVSYIIWDCSAGSEYVVTNVQCFNSQLSPLTCLPFEAGATTFVSLSTNKEVCFTLEFQQGWNIFSSPVQSKAKEMETIFQPLINNTSLVKIQDEGGNSMENWGIFGGWQNDIENISPMEGYKIKLSKDDNLEVCGAPVKYPFAIPLQQGWNIIGYPQSLAYDGIEVVQQLIDRGTLVKVQDEVGHSIEDWGIFGSWQNFIHDFIPGEGYAIKLSADDILWIYDSYPKSSAIKPEATATNHFKTEFEGNGVDHMNINLVGLPNHVLNVGDELAIFDGSTCVGVVALTSHHLQSQTVSIAASASDNKGMAGFTEGNPFTMKLWDSKQNHEFVLEPEIVIGTSTFTKHETTFASMEKYATTGLERIPGSDLPEINCYPNPFSDEVTIEIILKTDARVEVEVLNQLGQRVNYITTKQILPVGLHKLTWKGRNENNQTVSPGIYHLKVNIDGAIIHKKIVYSK
jgi:PKD repeat protein